jgi:hypothetical protein
MNKPYQSIALTSNFTFSLNNKKLKIKDEKNIGSLYCIWILLLYQSQNEIQTG